MLFYQSKKALFQKLKIENKKKTNNKNMHDIISFFEMLANERCNSPVKYNYLLTFVSLH